MDISQQKDESITPASSANKNFSTEIKPLAQLVLNGMHDCLLQFNFFLCVHNTMS